MLYTLVGIPACLGTLALALLAVFGQAPVGESTRYTPIIPWRWWRSLSGPWRCAISALVLWLLLSPRAAGGLTSMIRAAVFLRDSDNPASHFAGGLIAGAWLGLSLAGAIFAIGAILGAGLGQLSKLRSEATGPSSD